jgi:hypothetical protein
MPDWVQELVNLVSNRGGNGAANKVTEAAAAVPEIDASSGALAISALIAALLLVRALRNRAAL